MLMQQVVYLVKTSAINAVGRKASLHADLTFLLLVNYCPLILLVETNAVVRNLASWVVVVVLYYSLLFSTGTYALEYFIEQARRCRKCCRHKQNRNQIHPSSNSELRTLRRKNYPFHSAAV